MTKQEIINELEKRGVAHDPGSKYAELKKLLNEVLKSAVNEATHVVWRSVMRVAEYFLKRGEKPNDQTPDLKPVFQGSEYDCAEFMAGNLKQNI